MWEKQKQLKSDLSFYRAPRFKRDISTLKFKVDMPPAKETQNNMPMAMVMGPFITMGMASMSVSMLLGMVMWPIITKNMRRKNRNGAKLNDRNFIKNICFNTSC